MKENFGLYLILTDPIAGYEACAQAAVDCGVRYLQLRMKNASRTDLLETARTLRTITHGSHTHFIVNDDLSVAIESDADGVHLGQGDQRLTEARQTWNSPHKIFGLSTHNQEQSTQAQFLAPDYIGIGPIFPTSTKANAGPAVGILKATQIVQSTPFTTVAIGGINSSNLPSLLNAGIGNFCVVQAVQQATDPAAAIRTLQRIWKEHCFLT